MSLGISTFTGNYGLVEADRANVRKATGTVAQTITLNTTLGVSWACTIENANTAITPALNALVLAPSSGTIDGASTITSYRGEVRTVNCDGTNWVSICIRMGDARFDGITPTVKNLDGANQSITAQQWAMNVGVDFTWSYPGATTLGPYLSNGNSTLTVQPSTRYMFESGYEVSHTTASHNIAVGFVGSAGVTDVAYQCIIGAGPSQSALTPKMVQIITTSIIIQTGITATSTAIYNRGEISISTAGTLIPAMATSADVTSIVKKGSYFRCWAIGASTVTSVGAWS